MGAVGSAVRAGGVAFCTKKILPICSIGSILAAHGKRGSRRFPLFANGGTGSLRIYYNRVSRLSRIISVMSKYPFSMISSATAS